MKKRLLGAALCAALLAGCAAPAAELPSGTETGTIAYVPLDDRPDNVERVAYLAESLGYGLAMPEEDDYRTKLRGQPLNENGTQSGDREDLFAWVLEQEAAGCDRYVLSLDQLLSGGLVNSRSMFETAPLRLSDGTVMTEYQAVERLLETLAADAKNRVWLLDSVMRLAPTVGYDHWDLEGYHALRSYGMEARPHLSGGELTLANIQADYRLGGDGTALIPADFGLTEAEITEYLSARSRKLGLADWVQALLRNEAAGYGAFRLLIGIDDSSEEDSIQKNEIAYLRQGLRQGDAILSGVDDLAFKAVAKLYLEEVQTDSPSVFVSYYGDTQDQPACAYDYKPLEEIVEEHIAFFGLERAAEAALADMQLLVLTQPADAEGKTACINGLIQELKANREAERPTILIDAGNGQYGTAFHEALTERTELGWLLSYAGFLDMAIVTGTAMSHGVARYAFLREGQSTAATEAAFAKTLADSVLKDFCYKNVVREDILSYVRNDLGGNADNFWQPDIDRTAVRERLERGMEESTRAVLRNLERSNLIASLEPYAELGWGRVTLSDYRFPWDRAFEIGMDMQVGEMTAPHKSIFGIYYQ